jgi:hypothetical protein
MALRSTSGVTANFQCDGPDIARETGGATIGYLRGLGRDDPLDQRRQRILLGAAIILYALLSLTAFFASS